MCVVCVCVYVCMWCECVCASRHEFKTDHNVVTGSTALATSVNVSSGQ